VALASSTWLAPDPGLMDHDACPDSVRLTGMATRAPAAASCASHCFALCVLCQQDDSAMGEVEVSAEQAGAHSLVQVMQHYVNNSRHGISQHPC
jgi:hypothetical protein